MNFKKVPKRIDCWLDQAPRGSLAATKLVANEEMDEEEKNLYIEREHCVSHSAGMKKSVRFLSRGSASLAEPLRVSDSEQFARLPEA